METILIVALLLSGLSFYWAAAITEMIADAVPVSLAEMETETTAAGLSSFFCFLAMDADVMESSKS